MRGHGLPKRTTPPEQLGPALLGALISLVVPTVQAILRGFQRGGLGTHVAAQHFTAAGSGTAV
ncbi:hypothetical protein SAMN04489713_11355 [Actinomadura madurae]|uniref:Uncharacterized protein n=1 Tax=Actinomadura madurae TaxID=1993 RepID=A0A1I5P9R2_9ACTN|nr:hypothetical protein SAMN04489713_11355 [Actinomadura madurae]